MRCLLLNSYQLLATFAKPVAKHFSKISDAWPEKWIARNKPSAAANTHKIRTIFLTVMSFPHPKPSQKGKRRGRFPIRPGGSDHYELPGNALPDKGGAGFGALSPIRRTLLSRSDICMPDRASNSAGTCAAILAMSPVSLYDPAASPFPVETMVTLSILLRGSARARTTSGRPVMSLSTTAAWLY